MAIVDIASFCRARLRSGLMDELEATIQLHRPGLDLQKAKERLQADLGDRGYSLFPELLSPGAVRLLRKACACLCCCCRVHWCMLTGLG